MSTAVPWQLRMFERTLKKRLRLDELRRRLTDLDASDRCLLVTAGDNNGALNHHLEALGGEWSWAEAEDDARGPIADLLGSEVAWARDGRLPYADRAFDVVIAVDVHEHLDDPGRFTREMARVARPRGRVIITVPGGDPRKLANRMKRWLGMQTETYGHVRDGFGIDEVGALMRGAGIEPVDATTFSRFFTELVELAINVAYVKVLGRRSDAPVAEGTIAPQTSAQIESVGTAYRAYAAVYPAVRLFTQLDRLLFFTSGYVVMVEGSACPGAS